MQVNFYGTYRLIAGCKTVEFNIDRGSTVRQLIDAIVTRFPPLHSELLDTYGNLHPDVPLYINGRAQAQAGNEHGQDQRERRQFEVVGN